MGTESWVLPVTACKAVCQKLQCTNGLCMCRSHGVGACCVWIASPVRSACPSLHVCATHRSYTAHVCLVEDRVLCTHPLCALHAGCVLILVHLLHTSLAVLRDMQASAHSLCGCRSQAHGTHCSGVRAVWHMCAPAARLQMGWTCLTRAERTKRSGQVLHVGLDARQVQSCSRLGWRGLEGYSAMGCQQPLPHPSSTVRSLQARCQCLSCTCCSKPAPPG